MNARLVGLLTAVAVLAACGGDGDTIVSLEPSADAERMAVSEDAPVADLVEGFNGAGFGLLRAQPVEDNLVLSPLSIGHTLLMARAAADDPTGEAIDLAFGLPDGLAAHEAWNAIDSAIDASNEQHEALDETLSPVVRVAGRVWPSTAATPDQEWIDLLATHHGAGIETIDTAAPAEARDAINGWVATETNDLIPELLPEGFVNENTVLVLTDAVYFKAQWRTVFGKYGEVTEPFTRLDGSTTDTTYLVDREQPGPRGVGDGFVGAEIPYLGDDYTMLLIVPDEGRFADVRDRLSTDLIDEIDAAFTTGPYELHMPEWETTSSLDLLGWLTDIGAAPGSYPGIGEGVVIGGAVHGADITVDEIGTEAAAATALGFPTSGPPEPELLVAADKPFLYLIRHAPTGTVLFGGQVTDPGQ